MLINYQRKARTSSLVFNNKEYLYFTGQNNLIFLVINNNLKREIAELKFSFWPKVHQNYNEKERHDLI